MRIGRRTGIFAVGAALASVMVTGTAHANGEPRPAPPSWPKQTCAVDNGPVHFRTANGAMRYLARAYNCADIRALRWVTTPQTRTLLQWMTLEATNMRLTSCTLTGNPGWHYYNCTFTHDYPVGVEHDEPDAHGKGQAFLAARPAEKPGWYAGQFEGCG